MSRLNFTILLLLFSITVFGQKFNTTPKLDKVFSKEEIKDINTLTTYIEEKINIDGKSINENYKNWF